MKKKISKFKKIKNKKKKPNSHNYIYFSEQISLPKEFVLNYIHY